MAVERDVIELRADPLSSAAIMAGVSAPDLGSCGGVCVFEGRTRQESHPVHGPLAALVYEAYSSMALMQMRRLAREVRARWPVDALALVHRVGRVPVGEPSVVIVVLCRHREEAFSACRWLIDTLKQEVPIWKKEIWASGESTWVDPTTQTDIA